MDFFDFLGLIGGLALFLYGMEVMGDGLAKACGGELENILSKLTSSHIKQVLLGAGVTAIIQSSSATTVMVVGLVNSNIINLSEAVGVIMGANVGTTITSWLLSLAGIESTNFFIRLLKPESFSPIIAIVGVMILLFSKNEKKRYIASTMVGFAILMFGMSYMSYSLTPLSEMEEFRSLFVAFENPILGLIVGMVLTFIIQSSSASIGILQAFSMTGRVTFASAIPIIMGQNIGTCVTALLSSIGAGKNGKRAALIHLYFNLLGTVIFMTFFYVLHFIFSFSFMNDAINPVSIAIVHSVFNISSTIILLPFCKYLEKLARLSIPEKRDEQSEENIKIRENIKLLDDIFLENPSFAMSQCVKVTNFMAELSMKSVNRSTKCLMNYSDELFDHISKVEDSIDRYEDAISTYLVKLSLESDMTHEASRLMTILFRLIGYFERIGDLSFNISQASKTMHDENMTMSQSAIDEMGIYLKAINEVTKSAFTSYINRDVELAKQVEPLEDVIDRLTEELRESHINRLMKDECSVEVGFLWSDIIVDFERISDHCSNIAIVVMGMGKEDLDMHEYIENIKRSDNTEFRQKYNDYREKYKIKA